MPSGLLQKTAVGPPLFSMFISDLVAVLQSPNILFADDVKAAEFSGQNALGNDIALVLNWANHWVLHIAKGDATCFQETRRVSKVGRFIINAVNQAKNLGIQVTRDFEQA